MMRTSLIVLLAFAGSAGAQDTVFTVEFDVTTNTGEIRAEFFGDLPAGTTAIGTIWSDAGFRLTGDGPLDILDFNPSYSSTIFGDPEITGRGTGSLEFIGVQAPTLLGGNLDPSNPLWVADFSYVGAPSELDMQLVGQNSAIFLGNPSEPFGTIALYISNGKGLSLTFRVDVPIVPAPATLALAPIALLATRRRR